MNSKSHLKHYHSKPILEELESRQLFSGGIEGLLTEQVMDPNATYVNATPPADTQQPPAQASASETTRNEIVFVDTSVQGYESLLNDIKSSDVSDHNLEIITLDSSTDGIQQISQVLAERDNLDAVHIISHGSDGSLDLGNSQLNFDTLIQNQTDISAWGDSFNTNGDMLIYGCNVAETQFGQSFVEYLSGITNTEVAASEDTTGSADLGGDWQLEYQTGDVETEVVVSAAGQSEWTGLMAVTANGTVTSTNSTSTSQLTWSHTVNAGIDRVLFVEIAIDDGNAGVNSVKYGTADLTRVGRTAANHAVEIWALLNPTEGTDNVVISFTGNTEAAAGASTFNGVNQSTPYGTYAGNTGTTGLLGGSGAVNVASATGDLVIDVQYWKAISADTTGTGQTSQWTSSSLLSTAKAGSSVEEGASSVTMSGSALLAADWSIGAVSVKASINSTPVNTVPTAQTTNEDTAKVFSSANGNAITIADANAGGSNNQITLTITNGMLTLAGTTGLTFVAGDGTADSTMTLRGTASAINTALNGLNFTPTAEYSGGATLTVATKDSVLLSLDIDTGLLGRYAFENTSTLGTDSSQAAGYTASVVNGTAVSDATRGNVLSLAGDGYVQTTGLYGQPSSVTLAAWVNLTTADTGGAEVISLGDNVILRLDTGGKIKGSYVDSGTYRFTEATTTLAGTGWHHVAYTIDSAAHTQTVYIDGVAVASTAYTTSIAYSLATNSFIGKHGNGDTTYDFNGKIDEARIYNRALTGVEVSALAGDLTLTDTDTVAITVTAVNDAPLISAIEATTLAYTENGAATAISSSLVLADVDSANLSSATVQISANYSFGQDVLAFTNQNGITGSWNASTGVLTLTGNASVANYQTALRSVTYVNTADNPSTAERTISITVNDGAVDSNSVTRTISVDSVNDAPSFSVGTGRNYSVMSGMQFGNAVTQQADGKYILVGWSDGAGTRDFAVARYNTDGTLDTSFGGGNGYVITAIGSGAEEAQDVKVLANGKILVVGYAENGFGYDVALVQYNADGTLDTSFGNGTGKAVSGLSGSDDGYSFAVQSDGKILVAGSYSNNFMLMRFNSNGVIDTSFGSSGVINTDFSGGNDVARSMVLQSDGKIVVAGQAFNSTTYADFAVARYNSDGSLDTSFNGTGKVTVDLGTNSTDQSYSVALQSDGKILLSGFTDAAGTSDNALVRLNANGSLDTSFGGTGKVIVGIGSGSDFAQDVKIQGDGKLLTSGYTSGSSNDFSVVRYNSDGTLDTTFGGTGKVTTNFTATTDDRGNRLFLQGDGKIVVAGCTTQSGTYDLAIARYNSDGSLDTTFNPTSNTLGSTVSYTENATGVVLDSDVQIFDSELSSSSFNGLTLTIARNGGANSQDVFGVTGSLGPLTEGGNLIVATNIIGTVTTNSNGTLLLTFNSNATNTLANSAIRQITYRNTSDAPPASVQLNWTLNDANTGAQGSGGALTGSGTTTVNITAVNDAPVVSAIEATALAYTENGAATAITSTLTLEDLDNTNLTGATVQITGNYTSGQDVLAFTDQNGITGSWNASTGTLTLSGTATVSQYQTALRSVTYQNTSDAPSTASRTVSFSVTDGTTASNVGIRSITVTALNDAPVNSLPANSYTAVNTNKTFSSGNGNALQIADVDAASSSVQVTLSISHGTLTLAGTTGLTLVSGANGSGSMTYSGTVAAINTALNNGLTFTPDNNYRGLAQLTLTTSDQGNTGSGGTLTDTDILDVHVGAIVVTNTSDTISASADTSSINALIASDGGDGISLREAIAAANNTAGTDYIYFGISGSSVHSINLTAPLTITSQVVLDATSDDSFSANGSRPAIVLNGAGSVQDGIQLYGGSDGSTIRGLVIQNFTGDGIDIAGSNGHTIAGNWIGLNATGSGAAGNALGINLWNSSNNLIGGSTAADRNVISGNSGDGILIATNNGTSTGNLI
ncbi:DUF4347 domain-containing protein [Methylomonas fluvii]|uniref:DUF4347 domain-containing protein n=1 Tax=Methylomonas fluvii TaxID=1854564 RepID=A0ABR9DC01_9GAMM|nr:DUF4347 domain-containing protein [Methylomonas fluvii]MBD9360635.1 DUF4347 domain-containing protein [Methylomonas fluvii]